MNNEVAEFLKRAAQRRAQLEQQAKAQAENAARARSQMSAPREEAPILLSSSDEIVQAEVVAQDRISASVSRDISGPSRISAQVAQLGQKVDQADDILEAHLHQTFDHKLGRISVSTTSAPASGSPTGMGSGTDAVTSIIRLLQSPTGLRDAILLNEILQRPESRWE